MNIFLLFSREEAYAEASEYIPLDIMLDCGSVGIFWFGPYCDYIISSFLDRGKVLGGLPDVVTIMEKKVIYLLFCN